MAFILPRIGIVACTVTYYVKVDVILFESIAKEVGQRLAHLALFMTLVSYILFLHHAVMFWILAAAYINDIE